MPSKRNESSELHNERSPLQAAVIADTFCNEFHPISDDIPLALIPLVNRPLIDYTLEFLCRGGIDEVYVFSCSHTDALKAHLKKCKEEKWWSCAMRIFVIASKSCSSFGDCLRDIYDHGLIRGDFILVEPGVVANMNLKPLLELHKKISKRDNGAAMTLLYHEVSTREISTYPLEATTIVMNDANKIEYYKKTHSTPENEYIPIPLEVLTKTDVKIRGNLRDTHVSLCSPTVLTQFTDNFDFQTKDDFIRGLLMNEEVMESTLYCHILNQNVGGSVHNWRMYQTLSSDLAKFRMHPIIPPGKKTNCFPNNVIIGTGPEIHLPKSYVMENCVIGDNVTLGENVNIQNSFIFSNCRIGRNVHIYNCVIGNECNIGADANLTDTIIARGVVLKNGSKIETGFIKSSEPDVEFHKLGEKTYMIIETKESEDSDGDLCEAESRLANPDKTVDIDKEKELYEAENLNEIDDDDLSSTQSPLPDDTKLFFTEIVDSLNRGFEDKLDCKNLILEVNSSRYAYNIALNEVNFHVVRAILLKSLEKQTEQFSMPQLKKVLLYFDPLMSNYIRNASAITDCLKAFEDIATTENVSKNWIISILRWFYEKDYLSEDAILKWHSGLDEEDQLLTYVKPFIDWLKEAEETSSDDSSSEDGTED